MHGLNSRVRLVNRLIMISEFVKQSKKAAKNLKARPGRLVVVEYDKKERQNFTFDRSSDFSANKSHSNLVTPIIP